MRRATLDEHIVRGTREPREVILSRGLKITLAPGFKGPQDVVLIVPSQEKRTVSMSDLLEIIRIIANNEKEINKEKIERTGRFFFREAVNEVIDGAVIDGEFLKKYYLRQGPFAVVGGKA